MKLQKFYSVLLLLLLFLYLNDKATGKELSGKLPQKSPRHTYGNSLCAIRPLEYGFYYGENVVSFAQARRCCKSRHLTLATLLPSLRSQKLHYLRDALLLTFKTPMPPIGKYGQLYVSVKGSSQQDCHAVYFASPKEIRLRLESANCTGPERFVCEDNRGLMREPQCSKVKYVDILYSPYMLSNTKLSWMDAFHCCEEEGQMLVPFWDPEAKGVKYINEALKEETLFWTGGSRKNSIAEWNWPNRRGVSYFNMYPEYCLAANASSTTEIKLVDHACEIKLYFVCEILDTSSCGTGFPWVEFRIPKSLNTYYYSRKSVGTWLEALDCCEAKGYRMFSIVTPSEGELFANGLLKNETLWKEFQGIFSGIWLGARKAEGGKHVFVQLPGEAEVTTELWYSFYLLKGKGDCLTYRTDFRNKFILQEEPCHGRRVVLCEKITEKTVDHSSKIILGGRYFYSTRVETYPQANSTCEHMGMKLYSLIKNKDSPMIENMVAQIQGEKPYAIWLGYYRHPFSVLLPYKLTRDFQNDPMKLEQIYEVNYTKEEYEAKIQYTQKGCNAGLLQNGLIVIQRTNCHFLGHALCEANDLEDALQCPEFIEEKHFLLSPIAQTWYDARRCCSQADGNWQLYDLKNDTTFGRNIPVVKNLFTTLNNGFWTAGSNYVMKDKLVWFSSRYEFVNEPEIFYFHYMQPEDPLEEEGQCLEAIYDEKINKFQAYHTDCGDKRRYVCVKAYLPRPRLCEGVYYEGLERSNYFLASTPMTWQRAAQCCYERKGTLVIMDYDQISEEVYTLLKARNKLTKIITCSENYILNTIGLFSRLMRLLYWSTGVIQNISFPDDTRQDIWIGLSKHPRKSTYIWSDGEQLEDSSSFDNESMGAGNEKNCVGAYFNESGKNMQWSTRRCDDFLLSLCYFRRGEEDD